ncbi:MAG TPA: hypothetical protein VGL69_04810 [Solirubrobacteraceae bacterium]|jgi:hypothetical protein
MSKKADKSADKAAGGEKGNDKKKKKGADGAAGAPSVANHPRARYQVRRAKGWGGIAGFAIAAYLGYQAGIPTFDVGERALAAGIVGYMLAWACAVSVWRHLVLAELRAAVDRTQPAPDPDLIPARGNAPAADPATGQMAGVAGP